MPLYSRESPSLAIAYLASSLKKAGQEVSRFKFNLRFNNDDWISHANSGSELDIMELLDSKKTAKK